MKKITAVILALVLLTGTLGGCSKADGENSYPSRQINLHVPFGVGGNLDLKARLVSKFLEKELGQTVVVINKTGAAGVVGTTEFLAMKNEGYDLVFLTDSVLTLVPVSSGIGFTTDDFSIIKGFDIEKGGLFVSKKSGIKSYEDLVNYAKGNKVIFGCGGVATNQYILQKSLFNTLGATSDPLQHTSQSEGFTNVMGGHSNITWGGIVMAETYVESGDLVPIMTFADEPCTDYNAYGYAEVPTAKSLGLDMVQENFTFFAAKSGTDEAIITRLAEALDKIYADPEFQKEMEKFNPVMMPISGAETMDLVVQTSKDIEVMYKIANE